MPEIEIEEINQFKSLTSNLAVIKFTASWCGPCRIIAPAYKEIANKEYDSEINFLTIDIDEAQENKEMRGKCFIFIIRTIMNSLLIISYF